VKASGESVAMTKAGEGAGRKWGECGHCGSI
jgi:hypothetical protein